MCWPPVCRRVGHRVGHGLYHGLDHWSKPCPTSHPTFCPHPHFCQFPVTWKIVSAILVDHNLWLVTSATWNVTTYSVFKFSNLGKCFLLCVKFGLHSQKYSTFSARRDVFEKNRNALRRPIAIFEAIVYHCFVAIYFNAWQQRKAESYLHDAQWWKRRLRQKPTIRCQEKERQES